MDFEEYMAKNYSGEFDMPHPCEAYEAGRQSRQAEIDALQGKISKVLYAISESELYSDRAVWGIQDEIKELLK